ncbi:MAG: Ig-like domain-containing protein [Gemmataceae bacterium]
MRLLSAVMLLAITTSIWAQDVTLEAVPPVVVKTIPEAGAGEVDPKLTEIRVTFSKAMVNNSWSWSTLSKESFPTLAGKPRYLADRRTCVLPVKLQPGKTYAIWVNTQTNTGFRDEGDQAAVPYLLVFRTRK